MSDDAQVLARVTCPRYNCVSGKLYAPIIHEGLEPPPPYEQKCDNCDGKGYVEDWWSLAELLSVIVRFGP